MERIFLEKDAENFMKRCVSFFETARWFWGNG
jgi:hypothetical protein